MVVNKERMWVHQGWFMLVPSRSSCWKAERAASKSPHERKICTNIACPMYKQVSDNSEVACSHKEMPSIAKDRAASSSFHSHKISACKTAELPTSGNLDPVDDVPSSIACWVNCFTSCKRPAPTM